MWARLRELRMARRSRALRKLEREVESRLLEICRSVDLTWQIRCQRNTPADTWERDGRRTLDIDLGEWVDGR
jgi:hypothetical protein